MCAAKDAKDSPSPLGMSPMMLRVGVHTGYCRPTRSRPSQYATLHQGCEPVEKKDTYYT